LVLHRPVRPRLSECSPGMRSPMTRARKGGAPRWIVCTMPGTDGAPGEYQGGGFDDRERTVPLPDAPQLGSAGTRGTPPEKPDDGRGDVLLESTGVPGLTRRLGCSVARELLRGERGGLYDWRWRPGAGCPSGRGPFAQRREGSALPHPSPGEPPWTVGEPRFRDREAACAPTRRDHNAFEGHPMTACQHLVRRTQG
jgi:hypothetical protein